MKIRLLFTALLLMLSANTIIAVPEVPYVWQKDIHIQNENILSSHREYHAQNVKVGNQVTDKKPHGNVNVENSNIFIKANNVLLDRGIYINVGSTFKIKTTN